MTPAPSLPAFLLSAFLLSAFLLPVFLAASSSALSAAPAEPLPPAPVNLDFEEGEIGQLPSGWTLPIRSKEAGYGVELTTERPVHGRYCAMLRGVLEGGGLRFGSLMQSFSARAYRARRVRFRAAVRTDGLGPANPAHLWIRLDRPGETRGAAEALNAQPITSREWALYEVVADVPAEAERVQIGLLLEGDGRAWIDAAAFEVLGPAGEGNAAPRPLDPRGRENLVALTRLLGYVQYFHPSDEAAAADWRRVAIAAVEPVEGADNPASLQAVLERIFQPLAPTLRLFATGGPPPAFTPLVSPPPPSSHAARAGGSGAPGGAAPEVVAWRHRGLPLAATYSIFASHRLRPADSPDPLPDPRQPLVAEIGAGLSCQLPLALYRDAGGTLPHALSAAGAAGAATSAAGDAGATSPGAGATPAAGAVREAAAPLLDKPPGFIVSGNDRTSRLATVALAWNALGYFAPNRGAGDEEWAQALRDALAAAAVDADERAFLDTLRRLAAHLPDDQARVAWAGDSRTFSPPVRWEWIENQLVVTETAAGGASGLQPGDVVLRVDGREAAAALAAEEETIAAATPQWRRWRALNQLALGASGEPLRLEVRSHGAVRTVELVRTVGPFNQDAVFVRPPKIRDLRPGVTAVDLTRLSEAELTAALPRLAASRVLIFDLRGPTRLGPDLLAHLVDRPAASGKRLIPIVTRPDRPAADLFTPSLPSTPSPATAAIRSIPATPTTRSTPSTHSEDASWKVDPQPPHLTSRIAFLTDGRAINAAESYLAVVAANGLAEIVGSPTAGTDGDVEALTLPGRYTLTWTGVAVMKPDGSPLQRVGIAPSAPVVRTIAGVEQGRDELLDKAVEILAR